MPGADVAMGEAGFGALRPWLTAGFCGKGGLVVAELLGC